MLKMRIHVGFGKEQQEKITLNQLHIFLLPFHSGKTQSAPRVAFWLKQRIHR